MVAEGIMIDLKIADFTLEVMRPSRPERNLELERISGL